MPDRGKTADRLREYHDLRKRIISDEDLMRMWRDDALAIDVLSPVESAALCKRAQAGDRDARNRCVEGNLRLVPWTISRFSFERRGMPMPDLIQEGSIGLMHAVRCYRADAGYKFGTYAVRSIWSALMRATNQDRLIRIPEHTRLRMVAEERGELLKGHGPLSADIPAAAERTRYVESLDTPIWEGGDGEPLTIGDSLADPDVDIEGETVERASREHLHELLATILSKREMLIISVLFGLDGKEPRTLDTTGKMLGITRERIRQLKNAAILRLQRQLTLDPNGGVALKSALREMMTREAA